MGQAKNRGTEAERKANPQGDAWRKELNIVEQPVKTLRLRPPAKRMDALMATALGISLVSPPRRRR